jgi:hypothetical protein
MTKRVSRFAAISAVFLFWALPASAAEQFMSPWNISTWRIQNYVGDHIQLFYTGSGCGPASSLQLPAGASAEERERLWSTMSAAKLSNKRIFVYFDNAPATCGNILSYGYLE